MRTRPIASLALAALLSVPAVAVVDAAPMPEPRIVDGVPVLSGGVGEHERQWMERTARGYDLKAVFSLADGAYLSDVDVAIRDQGGNVVLETRTQGPWLFAKLDPGTYRIHASKLGRSVEQTVTIGESGQRVVRMNAWTARDAGGDVYPPSVPERRPSS